MSLRFSLLCLWLCFCGSVQAATFTVNSTNDVNDTVCNATHCSLREAIIASNTTASPPHTINFTTSGTITVGSTLDITSSVTINGTGITVSGGNAVRVFDITTSSRTVTFNGISIINGNNTDASSGGAGIRSNIANTTLRINNATFTGNRALHVEGSGGAISIIGPSTLEIDNSTFSNNQAGNGGANAQGGAINARNGTASVQIRNSTFNGNTTRNGGAIGVSNSSTLNIRNTTFSGNSATARGGAIYINTTGAVDIANTTIANNTATTLGGGIFVNNIGTSSLESVLFAGNTAGTGKHCDGALGKTLTLAGNNLIQGGDTDCNDNLAGNISATNLLTGNPQLASLGNYGGTTQTHLIRCTTPASAALDTGSNPILPAPTITTDQRGFNRTVNAGIANQTDIGATEFIRPIFNFSSNAYTVNEGSTGGTTNATVTINRTANTDDVTSVKISLAGSGTNPATAPDDYDDDTVITVDFANGESSKNINIPIVADTTNEPNETITLGLYDACGGSKTGSNGTATLTIIDDDYTLTVNTDGTGSGTVTGTGIDCGTDCTETVASGTSFTLTPTADSGSIFAGWSPASCGSAFPLTADTTCTATFNTTSTVTLTAATEPKGSTSGDGTGKVTATGIDCGSDCTETVTSGTTIQLTAVADTGSIFMEWTGDCSGINNPLDVMMNDNKTCTAVFGIPSVDAILGVQVTGAGLGKITGVGINFGSDGGTDSGELYAVNQSVKITATPLHGSTFGGWQSGTNCSNTFANPRTLTMNNLRTCIAKFDLPATGKTLTVTNATAGAGNIIAAGINCGIGTDCDQLYGTGSTIPLTATPNAGFVFDHWTGDCSGTNPTVNVTMDADKTCTANYTTTTTTYTLTVNTNGTGSGTTGGTASGTYLANTLINLTATANTGSTFVSWSPSSCGTPFNLTADTTCTATFNTATSPTNYTLTVAKTGTGSGTVTATGINCGTDCTETIASGTSFTLIPTAGSGSTFVSWSPSSCGTTFNLTANTTCTATFNTTTSPTNYTLTINTNGTGTGVTGGTAAGTYTAGTPITLTATPNSGSTLAGWTPPTCASTFNLNANTTCTATFNATIVPPPPPPPTNYTLLLKRAGTGNGTIIGAGINCGTDCTETYVSGTPLTLTATPTSSAIFAGWTGTCSSFGNNTTINLTINNNHDCTATFNAVTTHDLTIIPTGTGTGTYTLNPNGTSCGINCMRYPTGTRITLTGLPDNGSTFDGFSDTCSNNTLLLNTNTRCNANFTQAPTHTLQIQLTDPAGGQITSTPAGIQCGTTCQATFSATTDVTLTPQANTGFTFAGFTGDADCTDGTIRLNTAKTCTAQFIPTGGITFNTTQLAATEGSPLLITVNRTGNTQSALTITYTTTDGTATAADYTPTTGTLTWTNGDASPKTFTVTTATDDLTEGNETLLIHLGNGTNTLATTTATILDGFSFSNLQFATPDFTTLETAEKITLLVTRAGKNTGAATVTYQTQAGTATETQDYLPRAGILNWEDGDGTHKLIEIPIVRDNLTESPETFTVTLTNPTGNNVQLGTVQQAIVTILDSLATPTTTTSDAGNLQFTTATQQTSENNDTVTIQINRVGGSTGTISVNYATDNETAFAGQDYAPLFGTLTWQAGETSSRTLTIPLLRDDLNEGEETFAITLFNPTNGAQLGTPARHTITLRDPTTTTTTPPTAGVLNLTSTAYRTSENIGQLKITVTRQPPQIGQQGNQGGASVQYRLEPGTAQAGIDFITDTGVLTWLDGEQGEKSFNIKIINNDAIQSSRTFTLTLHNAQGAQLGTQQQATIQIDDDDISQLRIEPTTLTLKENEGAAVFTVIRLGSGLGKITLNYKTQDIGATASTDYTPSQRMLTWENGSTLPQQIVIPILRDRLIESIENFTIQLDEPISHTGGQVILQSPRTLTVTIEDEPPQTCNPLNNVVDCYITNRNTTQQDLTIGINGVIAGGTLSGFIQNNGEINGTAEQGAITALPNTRIRNGIVRGQLHGSNDPTRPSYLENVTIAENTILTGYWVINYGTRLPASVQLDESVKFIDNQLIPHNLTLSTALGFYPPTATGMPPAVNLRRDILLNPSSQGILSTINGLFNFYPPNSQIEQNPTTGYITYTDLLGTRFVLLPKTVRQSLQPVGAIFKADGSLNIHVHTGREIILIPVVGDMPTLQAILSSNVSSYPISIQDDGRLYVHYDNSNFYVALPDNISSLSFYPQTGLYAIPSPHVQHPYVPSLDQYAPYVTVQVLVYADETGTLRQQYLFPAAAQPSALTSLGNGGNRVLLLQDGRVELPVLAGVTDKAYTGLLDYQVTYTGSGGNLRIQKIPDANFDGIEDFAIFYPDGTMQRMYQLR